MFVFKSAGDDLEVHGSYQCTFDQCQAAFIAVFEKSRSPQWSGPVYLLDRVLPKTPRPARFSDEIAELSGAFVRIVTQARAAQAADLGELYGTGLRKALEFLLKDFLISRDREQRDEIAAASLSRCISQFVDDPSVKIAAERAAWLGNDETHFYREWPNADIRTLESLLDIVVNWITGRLLVERVEREMPKRPRK